LMLITAMRIEEDPFDLQNFAIDINGTPHVWAR
jgi:hypothetical protein